MASAASTTTSTVVTLPPSLVFMVTNFHSFVNIKLDSTNYLLWRIQVENIMQANGFFEYLDGSIPCPDPQIRATDETLTPNPAFALWKLIDTQLLSCLTASLSPTTLPYILGLHHAHEVWGSLSNRYNSLSKSQVQDLKSKLYNITKSSTIECYVDTIKEYSQKIAAAGSPVEDDDLIFHTLRGLPKVFNGFKTTVHALQTSGTNITFNDVINMLNGEDIQLLQESNSEVETTSVLVATHGHGKVPEVSSSVNATPLANSLPQSFAQLGISTSFGPSQQFGSTSGQIQSSPIQFSGQSTSQFMPSQPMQPMLPQYMLSQPMQYVFSQSMPPQNMQQMSPQFHSSQFRGFGRGRGRGPCMPCEICGRSNHTTNYCYYQSSPPQFPLVQWRPPVQSAPWMTPTTPWMNNYAYPTSVPNAYPAGVPMFQPPLQTAGSVAPNIQSSLQNARPGIPSQTNFAGFTEAYTEAEKLVRVALCCVHTKP
ncbi:hypothetical protein C3L33_15238, partial [Rhododendron williamsianum]